MTTPIGKYFGFFANRNKTIASFVAMLIGARHPAAVVERVALVVVDSIKGCAIKGNREHVTGKSIKGLPCIANGNASRAVVGIALLVLVAATLDHAGPYLVSASAMLAMCCFSLANAFCASTSAALGCASLQAAANNYFRGSAVTFAFPPALPPRSAGHARGYKKKSEAHPHHVDQLIRHSD